MSLHDWAGCARNADQLAAALDEALRQNPDSPRLLLGRMDAGSMGGRASLRTGHAAEAAAILAPLLSLAERVPADTIGFEGRQTVLDRVSIDLGEAWIDTGEPARARHLLQDLLPSIAAVIAKEPSVWVCKSEFAAASCILARTFDSAKPEEAARRKELLDHAAAILAKGEAEGQLTNDNKELQAKVAALRTAKD
jgi:hypothetical protein